MAGAARLNDRIEGITACEHSEHDEPCDPVEITGEISGNCSADVFVNGLSAATIGSVTTERDSCCGSSEGSIAEGSSSVFINGKNAARIGDSLNAHDGTGFISEGSSDVFIG